MVFIFYNSEKKEAHIIKLSIKNISKDYGSKLLSNFSVLMALQFMFLAALMVMQLIRHESMRQSIMHYMIPLICVTVPYLLVLASLTILFDVVAFLKGAFGNQSIFTATRIQPCTVVSVV